MSCSASGSITWRYRAWSPARPRCFWSTGAREAGAATCSFRADCRIGLKRALAPLAVIDHRLRIGVAEHHPGAGEFERRRAPWLMDQGRRQPRELRHPAPDIGAIGIELLALQDRIEYAEIRRG